MKAHMKGKLVKQDGQWQVLATEEGIYYPLDYNDANDIKEQEYFFDNIEARIAAYPDVEFEIVDYWETGLEEVVSLAKLIKTRDNEEA